MYKLSTTDPSPLVQYGTVVHSQLHGYRLYYFLPDPCNSSDTSVIQNERENERVSEEESKRKKNERKREKAGDHRGNTGARYRRIANRGFARSVNNTGALSHSRGDP